MNIKKSASKLLEYEVSNVGAITSQLIRNIENFQNSSLILIGKNGVLDYYNSRTAKRFELQEGLVTDTPQNLNILEILQFLADRGDFGPGDPTQFVKTAAEQIVNVKINEEECVKTYLTMPSGTTLRISLIRNTDSTVTLLACDVSDQRRDENMLEMALDIGLAGYWVFDKSNKNCQVVSRYLSNLLTEKELHTLETTGPSSLFHFDDLARSREMWDVVKQTGKPQHGTLRIMTKRQGVRWLSIVLMPETDALNCTRVLAFFNDVTDSLRQQDKLRHAKHLAEESLRTKENFLARMSHEIRTPMNAVIGMADALIHHHADPIISPQLELIQKSATSILKMLDETLTHSRLNTDGFALDPTPDSPAEVVKDVCALWEQQALKNNGTIRCLIKDDVPPIILFDKFRYEQCVNNLLSNAVKFTRGGKIDVVLTVMTKETSRPHLVLAVRDTGIGMTVEQQRHIFEAYTQADKSISSRFGGTGLGMNITKQIVERMGGTISVRSELGSGSMFVMKVPLVAAEAKSELEFKQTVDVPMTLDIEPKTEPLIIQVANEIENEPFQSSLDDMHGTEVSEVENDVLAEPPNSIQITSESEPATSSSMIDDMLVQAKPEVTVYSDLRILVVDDNPTNHLVVKSLLTSVVSTITLAANGAEALEILETTPIDIVLMDIHMPIMDGIECTLAIRSSEKNWKDVIIIALTADPNYQHKKLCKNIGMDEALAKPVRLNDLLGALDAVLGIDTSDIEAAENTSDILDEENTHAA